MKKIASLMLTVCILLIRPSAERLDYYCVRKKGHERPELEARFSFIKEHGGYYIGPDEKVLYLTFDAGYENGNVSRILDVLKEHDVKGAFFVLENLILRSPDLVMRMANEGHLICNHTGRHKDMTKLNYEQFAMELKSLDSVCMELTGKCAAKFYRPPEGAFNEDNLVYAERLGYKTVFWSLAYADWDNNKQPSREAAKKLLRDNTHNGAIILLHPTSKTNADILGDMIEEWKGMGYRFGTLDEL